MPNLIDCKDCGHMVSRSAKTCPNCGTRLKPSGCLTAIMAVILIPTTIALVAAFSQWMHGYGNSSKRDWVTEDRSIGAYMVMEDFVKDRLKSPGTAKFPGVWEQKGHVTRSGQVYTIKSYVDAENSYGATVRIHFKGEVTQTSRDKWRLTSLDLVQR